MSTESNTEIHHLGRNWFFGAGIIAILFACFLARADFLLTISDVEEKRNATLYELRSAQTGLPSGVTDSRQIQLTEN